MSVIIGLFLGGLLGTTTGFIVGILAPPMVRNYVKRFVYSLADRVWSRFGDETNEE